MFIELTQVNGEPLLLNINHIIKVKRTKFYEKESSEPIMIVNIISVSDEQTKVKEGYSEVWGLIVREEERDRMRAIIN